MRTTVTLDTDVAAKLKKAMRERGLSMKEVINSTLRAALSAAPARAKPFKVKPRNMGPLPPEALVKTLSLADALEDMEILRKMSVGR